MADDAAEQAYAAALEEIARVKEAGENQIFFNGERFRALDRIPQELSDLKELDHLSLNGTNIKDVGVLSGKVLSPKMYADHSYVGKGTPHRAFNKLRILELRDTLVSDIAPVADLQNLSRLDLHNTSASDLVPLAGLKNLVFLNLVDTNAIDLRPLTGLRSRLNHSQNATAAASMTADL